LRKFDVLDHPDPRKIHTTPTPRMGGVAIYIAFVIPMVLVMYFDRPQQGIIIGSGIALLIGAMDDIWGVSAVIKLIALFLLTVLIWKFGVITNLPFERFGLPHEISNLILTMLWLTGITSAMNALDHMDGLAGGIAVVAAWAYFAVSLQTQQYFWGLISIALIGSLLGFLFFNRHPAKIFMGDSGSFFLGFSLAAIGIMGGWSKNPIKASVVPVAILSVPIFDLCYVIFFRRFNGTTHSLKEAIVYCGKDHIGHRLTDLGFTQVGAVRVVYLISATIAASALVLRHTEILETILLLIQIFMVYIVVIALMTKMLKQRTLGTIDVGKSTEDGI